MQTIKVIPPKGDYLFVWDTDAAELPWQAIDETCEKFVRFCNRTGYARTSDWSLRIASDDLAIRRYFATFGTADSPNLFDVEVQVFNS